MRIRRGNVGARRSGGAARAGTLIVALALPLLATGCGGFFRHYDVAPNGLERTDYELRRLLSEERYDTAFAHIRNDRYAPKDDLLRQLYVGLIAHYAGRHKEAANALEHAAALADDRYTKSISRGALSLVTSDYALKYEPSTTERLLLPYYAALDYLTAGDGAGAAVEARRIATLLERARDDHRDVDPAVVRFLRYFSGAVFESNGDLNDANVAYRNAVLADTGETPGPGALPPRLIGRPEADSGEVVVILERGFVAHRVEQGLFVALGDGEVTALAGGSTNDRYSTARGVATRLLSHHDTDGPDGTLFIGRAGQRYDPGCDAWHPDVAGAATDSIPPDSSVERAPTPVLDLTAAGDAPTAALHRGCDRLHPGAGDIDYLLHIAWPAFHEAAAPTFAARIGSDAGAELSGPALTLNVSSAVVSDFRRELPLLLARTIARASTKYAISRALESEVSKKDEKLGKIVGVLGDAAAVLTERADTRSWTLLPAGISIARLRLHAGTHTLWLLPDGSLSGAPDPDVGDPATSSRQPLGTVDVPVRGVAILSARLWH